MFPSSKLYEIFIVASFLISILEGCKNFKEIQCSGFIVSLKIFTKKRSLESRRLKNRKYNKHMLHASSTIISLMMNSLRISRTLRMERLMV